MSDFGLYFFNARWYDPASGRFNQPDTTVPDPNNPQAWDRYAYVGNNPCRYNDPDGHCWPVCTMVIGALVAGTVDAIVQYNQKGTVDLKEVAVAATVGAVGGLVGGAIIAPLAQAAGAYAFAAAGSLWAVSAETALTIGVTTELATGVALSAGTNVVLSATHRELDKSLRGGEITWNSYTDDMKRHWQNDAFIGGVSYGLSSLVSESLPRTFYPPQNTTQKILYSGMEGAGVGISNTDLMDTVIPNILDNKEESWQDYWRRYERYERYER